MLETPSRLEKFRAMFLVDRQEKSKLDVLLKLTQKDQAVYNKVQHFGLKATQKTKARGPLRPCLL